MPILGIAHTDMRVRAITPATTSLNRVAIGIINADILFKPALNFTSPHYKTDSSVILLLKNFT
jgi:hypothetical protein